MQTTSSTRCRITRFGSNTCRADGREQEEGAGYGPRTSLRARMACRLFELAVAADRKEIWNVVWEGLEAKGRL
jgi:hypothetical protein